MRKRQSQISSETDVTATVRYVRDAEWATGLEKTPPVCVQLKVWTEAPSLSRWLAPRP